MERKIFIVEDKGKPGEGLLEEARRQGFDTQWLRPYNSGDSAEQDHVVHMDTLDQLVSFLSEERPLSIWLWDIGPKFPEKFMMLEDYEKERRLYDAMLKLMKDGHLFVITSSQYQMETFQDNFMRSGAPEASITFISSRGKTYERIIYDAVRASKGSILTSIGNIPQYQFAGGSRSAPQDALTHDWIDNKDKLKAWKKFKKILMDITGAPETILPSILKPYPADPSGLYKTVQTLVGVDAKVQTGRGYVPGLGILPLLLLRALVQSGVWTDNGIWKLFEKISWTEKMREIGLCSVHQPQSCIREWVEELGDTLLPILVKNHPKTGPNEDLKSIELNEKSRFFRLVFTSEQSSWSQMLEKVDKNGTAGGDTFFAWRNVSHLLGACGPSVGRDTKCIINVYAQQSQTYWDFQVTP